MVCIDGMCTVWKDSVLKLCESSGRCECTLCAGGLVCVFVHYLNPPPSPQVQLSITGDTVMRQAAVLFLHVACVHVYFTIIISISYLCCDESNSLYSIGVTSCHCCTLIIIDMSHAHTIIKPNITYRIMLFT